MALTSNRLTEAVTRKARSRVGVRFGRFAVSAVGALGANEITVAVCLLLNMNAGTAAGLGWLAGAIVSYVLARWAFGRKGKPPVHPAHVCDTKAQAGKHALAVLQQRPHPVRGDAEAAADH